MIIWLRYVGAVTSNHFCPPLSSLRFLNFFAESWPVFSNLKSNMLSSYLVDAATNTGTVLFFKDIF